MDQAYFRMFARYNHWANARLYAAAGKLPAEEYLKQRPAFFKSIHGTLNHLLVADRIWLGRILEGQAPPLKLDQILYGDFVALEVARRAEDQRFVHAIESMAPDRFRSTFEYRNTRGERFVQPMREVLAHVFNHQTHHRGQVHDQLSQTSVPPPELDLIYFLRERPA
jgi:uncharacterized damage-inducible protein DinB